MTPTDADRTRITPISAGTRRSAVDRLLAPYFREPSLWPVTLVLLAHGVLGIAIALLDAIRGGMGYGLVALVLVAVGSGWSFARDARLRRLGATSATLAFCWLAGAATAWAADHYGVY